LVVAAPDIVEQMLDQLEPLIARQRRALAREGCLRAVSSTQMQVLFLLSCDAPQTMGRLAEKLDVSLPSLTGIVERMVEHGLVERGRAAGDRRVVTVAPTAAGRAAVEEIDLVRRRALAQLLSRLDAAQQDEALRIFTALRRIAESLDSQGVPA
jgi:DNA-binding MarR family transcriptional regulator